MNVYDFDGTIYDGDSTVDFYLYCLKRKPSLALLWPKQGWAFVRYALGLIPKESFKEAVYLFLVHLREPETWVESFWDTHEKKIKSFYRQQKKPDDLVISASPEFLILPICERLGIRAIASRIDLATGKHQDGINCHGQRKVERFYEVFPQGTIDEFYSDSTSDEPLKKLAKQAYLVKKERRIPWE